MSSELPKLLSKAPAVEYVCLIVSFASHFQLALMHWTEGRGKYAKYVVSETCRLHISDWINLDASIYEDQTIHHDHWTAFATRT
jgi:hypothetical protein